MGEAKRRAGILNGNDHHARVDGHYAQQRVKLRYEALPLSQKTSPEQRRLQARLDQMTEEGRARAAAEADRKAAHQREAAAAVLKAKRSEAARKAAATRKAKREAARVADDYGVNDGKRIDGVGNLF